MGLKKSLMLLVSNENFFFIALKYLKISSLLLKTFIKSEKRYLKVYF